MALALVPGADFWCKLMSGVRPGRSKGVPGSISGLKPRKTGPKIDFYTHFAVGSGFYDFFMIFWIFLIFLDFL